MKGIPQGRYTKEFREEAAKLVTEESISLPEAALDRLRNLGELRVSDEVALKLKRMSSATISASRKSIFLRLISFPSRILFSVNGFIRRNRIPCSPRKQTRFRQ